MSKDLFTTNNSNWEKFCSTGSVYDYLKYKSREYQQPGNIWIPDNYGGICEKGDKGVNNKGS